jgi:hypothetical protein
VHPRYQKKNLLSWFLAKCEKLIKQEYTNIKCLVAFADTSYGHSGAVYKASNWKFHSKTNPDYYYVDETGWVMHKKTLYNQANKMHLKEVEFAEKYEYRKIHTPPLFKYILRIN